MVGKLNLFFTNTRPNLAFAIEMVSRYMTAPPEPHLDAMKHIFRYVKGTMNLGLKYYNKDSNFTSVDWVGDQDQRKSTLGFMFQIGTTIVLWCSKKQPTVALSSTEVKYRVLMEGV